MKFGKMTRKRCIASVKKFWKKAKNNNESVNSSMLGKKTRKLKNLSRKNMNKVIQTHVKDVCRK
jgi:hypothetical protein